LDFEFESFVVSYIGYVRVTRCFEQSVAHREYPALAVLYFGQRRLLEREDETRRVDFDADFIVFEISFERFGNTVNLL